MNKYNDPTDPMCFQIFYESYSKTKYMDQIRKYKQNKK